MIPAFRKGGRHAYADPGIWRRRSRSACVRRRAGRLAQTLGIGGISKPQVLQMARSLDEAVEALPRTRRGWMVVRTCTCGPLPCRCGARRAVPTRRDERVRGGRHRRQWRRASRGSRRRGSDDPERAGLDGVSPGACGPRAIERPSGDARCPRGPESRHPRPYGWRPASFRALPTARMSASQPGPSRSVSFFSHTRCR